MVIGVMKNFGLQEMAGDSAPRPALEQARAEHARPSGAVAAAQGRFTKSPAAGFLRCPTFGLLGFLPLAFLLLPAPAKAQAETPIVREGRYWVQTVTGSLAAVSGGRLRITSFGGISVQGEAGSQVRYVARKRVRAGSEAEARKWLEQAAVRASRQGATVVVVASDPQCGHCGFSADLQVTAPRSTDETILATRGGSLQAYDLDGRVNAQTAGGSIQMDRIGKSVRAETAGGSIKLGSIGGPVRCETAGGAIQLGTAKGDAVLTTNGGSIDADEVGGSLRAETAGGSIHVRRVAQSVNAETAGGSILLGQIGGSVNAETAGGSITVEAAPGGVHAENAAGSIRLLDVAGALRASTAAGNIWAQLMANHPLADSTLDASAGSIVVLIPDGARLTLRASVDVASTLNRIRCEFPGIVVRMDQGSGPRGLVAEGMLNGGGPVLRIRNTTGSIEIRRR
jgi:DUF4097 and DUF4098 domain-containing protein YvlB